MGFHQINNMANILEKKSCNEVHFFFCSKYFVAHVILKDNWYCSCWWKTAAIFICLEKIMALKQHA